MLLLMYQGLAANPSWVVSAGLAGVQLDPRFSLIVGVAKPVTEWFAVEVGMAVHLPGSPLTDLDRILVVMAHEANPDSGFRQPVDTQVGSVGAWGNFGWKVRPPGTRVWGALGGRAGFELLAVTRGFALVNPNFVTDVATEPALYEEGETLLVPALSLGVTLDAWFGDRIGVRLAIHERAWVMEEPDYGSTLANGEPVPLENTVFTSPTSAVSLLVAL